VKKPLGIRTLPLRKVRLLRASTVVEVALDSLMREVNQGVLEPCSVGAIERGSLRNESITPVPKVLVDEVRL